MTNLDTHYRQIIRFMIQGRVIAFFGAGVNLCSPTRRAGMESTAARVAPARQ